MKRDARCQSPAPSRCHPEVYCERLRPAHFAMLRFGFRRVLTAREAAPLPPQPNTRLTNPQIEAVRSIDSHISAKPPSAKPRSAFQPTNRGRRSWKQRRRGDSAAGPRGHRWPAASTSSRTTCEAALQAWRLRLQPREVNLLRRDKRLHLARRR